MSRVHSRLASIALAVSAAFPCASFATNGYFMPGFGSKSLGMGGVGIAYSSDSFGQAANPAIIAGEKERYDLNFGVFHPVRRSAVERTPPFNFEGNSWSRNEWYPVPALGMIKPGPGNWTFGAAAVGNGGMNTTYKENFFRFGTAGSVPLGVDMMQLLVPLTASFKATDTQSFGVSLVPAIISFEARGLEAFQAFDRAGFTITSDPDRLTNNGHDTSYGYGFRFGWAGRFFDSRLTLGATYATESKMSRFKKYSGLFAGHGGFDIPASAGLGLAFMVTPELTLAMEAVRIYYSHIPALGNPGMSTPIGLNGVPSIRDPSKELGNPNGMGFGWTDQDVYKFGVEYKLSKDWTARAGYNYGKSPIPDNQVTFSLLAPATTESHYMLGATYNLSPTNELTASYLYAARHKQRATGQNIVGTAEFEMYQQELDFAYSWKF